MSAENIAIDRNLSFVKAFSKEQRIKIAKEIRTDSDLRNAINGVGGLSEICENARLQGTITKNRLALPRLKVKIWINKILVHSLITNEQGYFKIDVVPGNYLVVVSYENKTENIFVKALRGITSTINHDFYFALSATSES